MANNHNLVVLESMQVIHKLSLDQDGYRREYDYSVDGRLPNSVPIIECTCGKEFDDSFEDGVQHLRDVVNTENGESVTTPPEK